MGNSRLVKYTAISPNKSVPRNQSISKITIHHMAGNLSLETCGNVFAPTSAQASSNYGIDSNGKVGMYVEEKDRAWTSSNAANDNMAVTIEVANSASGGDWPVSDKAYNSAIDLCVDICRRNNIASLNFNGTTTGNMTLHKYFSATTCPGPYLESRMGNIASSVNARLTECKSKQSSVNTAANKLRDQGIVNTPEYWYENFHAIQYLGDLIIGMANATKNSSPISTITTADAAIDRLALRGIINTAQFWKENHARLDYLSDLLIAVAKRIA